jgi:hypothetical protein
MKAPIAQEGREAASPPGCAFFFSGPFERCETYSISLLCLSRFPGSAWFLLFLLPPFFGGGEIKLKKKKKHKKT